MHIHFDEIVKFVPLRLEDRAYDWFEELLRRFSQEKLDWFLFHEQFMDRFVKPLPSQNFRIELKNLRQKYDLPSYISTFESLCNEIPDLSKGEKIDHFIGGLNPSIRVEKQRYSLGLSRKGKLEYEKIRDRATDIFTSQSKSPQTSTNVQEPVGGGIQKSSRRVVYHTKFKKSAGNKESLAPQDKDGKMNQQNTKISYAKLTPAEKQEIIDKRGCLYCRELESDHIASNCPKKLQKSKDQPLNN
jgi:hypothetical protein